MSYEYTDQQLNHLNRDDNVYSVNPKFIKRKGVGWKRVTEKPRNKDETNIIETPGQQFQVIKVYSDPKTGFDGMAVVKGYKKLYNYCNES